MARNDRVVIILLLSLLFAVALVGAVLSGTRGGPDVLPRRTSFSSGPSGLRALYLGLQEMGFSVSRLREPYARLPQADALIVALTMPSVKLRAEDWEALEQWLEPGRVAVIAYEEAADAPEMSGGGGLAPTGDAHVSAQVALPTALTAQAPVVNVSGRHRLTYPDPDPSWEHLHVDGARSESSPAEAPTPAGRRSTPPTDRSSDALLPADRLLAPAVPLYDAGGAVVSIAHVGQGTVLLMATPWTLCNQGIGQADNFALVVGFLDSYAPGKSVVFDEIHHGFGARQGLWSVIPRAGKAALAHALVAALLLVIVAGRRLGPAAHLPPPDRTRAEYLTSMASILLTAGATDLATRRLLTHFRSRAVQALRSPSVDEKVVLGLAEALPGGMGAELRAAMDRGEELARAGRPPVAQVLEWARRTTELLNRMECVGNDNL
jgi:hypothetical protein